MFKRFRRETAPVELKPEVAPLIVNGIRIDKLLDAPLEVWDPIPETEYAKYLLRGANVGRLALNLMTGKNRINPYDDLYMHVGLDGKPDTPRRIADAATWVPPSSPTNSQYDIGAVAQFAELTGVEREQFPGLVLGVSPSHYVGRLAIHPSNSAKVIAEPVPFSAIDPHSQAFLSELFEVDLRQH